MTPDPIEAAERLATVLQRENAALAAMDLHGAAVLLPEKQAAAATLLEALAAPHPPQPRPLADPAAPLAPHLALLADLANENRRRLEHAIAVQGRVIGLIARALRNAAPPTPRYGATGQVAACRPPPVTLSARA